MANYWIIPVKEENWKVCEEKGLLGVHKKVAVERIKRGDIIIVYIPKTRARELGGKFVGAFKVASDWYMENKPLWPDEAGKRRAKYPWRARIEPVVVGKADARELAPKLSFIENKNKYQVYLRGTPANFKKPIPEADASLIMEALRAQERPTSHRHLIECLILIGRVLGFHVSNEEQSPDSLYRYDVVWRGEPSPMHRALKVFEVVASGDVDTALARLKHAWDTWGSELYLVVSDRRKREPLS